MPNYNVRLKKRSGNGWDTLYPETLASLVTTAAGTNVQVFMDTVYDTGATPNANGAMTKEDKTKLDGIEERANRYVHPNDPSTRHVSDTQIDAWNDKYTKIEVDNLFNQLVMGLDWKESVGTFNDIANTYPNPQDGWTVNVKDTDITYRYDGTGWIAISANAIPLVSHTADGKMSSADKIKLDNLGPRVDGLANDLANLNQGIAGDLTAVINRINNVEQTVNGYNGQIAALENDKADKNHHHDNRYSQLNHNHDTQYAAINHTHNYLPLTGGALTGNVNTNSSINFTAGSTSGIRYNNNLILRNNGTSTVISSINNTMFFRPQGDTNGTNQMTLGTNGDLTATRFVGPLQGNADTATRLQTPRNINGVAFDGTTNITIADNTKVLKAGDTMTGALNNNLSTGTYLAGNQGRALVNSTSAAGGYTTLLKSNSTNGFFTVNNFQDKLLVGYTAKTTVGGGTNRLDRQITLLNEAGNTIFPGQVTATSFNGNATSATRLQNARTVQLTGAVTGQANFDGSTNIQINTTLANQPKGRLVRLRNRVAVTTTTNTVNIGIGGYNVNDDILNVYLAGVRLEPTVEYTNTQSQITLTGGNNFVNGDVVSFEVIQMQ